MAKQRTWTDDELRDAVAQSRTVSMVLRRLQVRPGGKTYRSILARIDELALDTRHFTKRATLRTAWTDADLREAVAHSQSLREAIMKLGLIGAGGNFRTITARIVELDIDTSHLVGRGWARGRRFPARRSLPLSELLVRGRPTGSHDLKRRLIQEGLKRPACERCGWSEISPDGRQPLELDHINGDHLDNRLENLRILCPNCHSLQPTHRGSNRKRRAWVAEPGDTRES